MSAPVIDVQATRERMVTCLNNAALSADSARYFMADDGAWQRAQAVDYGFRPGETLEGRVNELMRHTGMFLEMAEEYRAKLIEAGAWPA